MKHDGAPSHRNQESLVQLFGQNLERLATATLSAALDEDPALQEEGALQYLIDVAHMELDSRPGRALGIMQAVMPFADVADVVPGDPVASMLFRASALKGYPLALRLTDPAKAEQTIRTAAGLVDQPPHPVLTPRLPLP